MRRRRDRLPARADRRAPRPAVPSASLAPKSITTMRSTRFMTKSMSCSTSRIVMPSVAQARAADRRARASRARRRPAAGSSRITSTGSAASARATSRMRCWPSGRLPASSSSLSPRPTRSNCAAPRRARALPRRGRAAARPRGSRRACADRCRAAHCRAASCSAAASRAGRCARCRRRRSGAGASAVMSSPRNTIRPPSASQRAGDQVEQRGLAGAVRADQARAISPALDLEADVVDGDQAAEALGARSDREHGSPAAAGRVAAAARRRAGGCASRRGR